MAAVAAPVYSTKGGTVILGEINQVQKPVVKHAKATGWVAWKMKIEGINGCPDYWFFKDGHLLIMEFKATDKEPNAQQVRRHKELREAGFEVHVIDDPARGIELLDAWS